MADYLHVSPELQTMRINDGTKRNKWQNVVQWARATAKQRGWVDSFGHGRWGLTEKGNDYARTLADSGLIEDVRGGRPNHAISADEYARRRQRAEEIGVWGERFVIELEPA